MQNLSHTNNLDTCCIVIKLSEMTRMHHNSLANFEKKKTFSNGRTSNTYSTIPMHSVHYSSQL